MPRSTSRRHAFAVCGGSAVNTDSFEPTPPKSKVLRVLGAIVKVVLKQKPETK